MTAEEVAAFERDIAERYNRGEIRSPIHLDGGNEHQLVEVFKTIDRRDWVCGTWRMHGKCLLHGVPPERLRADIIAGKSITLCYPEYKIVSSAIVGGILPIAMGIAWWIKRTGGKERVHCFLGDMAATTGLAHESFKYATAFDLPVRWIIEDNGKSVGTDTAEAWNGSHHIYNCTTGRTTYYKYVLTYPHSGAGKRIEF